MRSRSRSRVQQLAGLAIGVCSIAASLEGSFGYRKPIQVDSTRVVGSTDLYQFPVLVSLQNDTDLQLRVASPGGFDIQFRAADGTSILDHEIERYDPATGSLTAWVRVPRLPFNADTDIYIYYGDSAITCTLENPSGVWNSNYVGVWHLAEDPTISLLDSTTFANHGTSGGSMLPGDQVPGQIAGSLDFDGLDDLVDAGSASVLDDVGRLTASAWIFPRTAGASSAGQIVSKYGPAFTGRWFLEVDDTAPESRAFEFNKNATAGAVTRVSVNASVTYGGWQHVVVTWTGSELGTDVHIFKNGTEVAYQSFTDSTPPLDPDAAYPFVIGNREGGTSPFDGLIDEVRLSNSVRSAEWIQTEYNNQSFPTKGAGCADLGFVCVGPQEIVPGGFIEVSVAAGVATPGAKDGGLAWGDFNADGCLDLLVNTEQAGIGSVLYMQDVGGSCLGTFTDVTACLAPDLSAGIRERSAVWGDLNNDGFLDFVRNSSSPDIEIYTNNGPVPAACGLGWSAFTKQVLDGASVPFTFNAEGVGILDYDADGDLDLLSDQDGAIAIFENVAGVLTYDAGTGLPTSAGGKSDNIALTDLDVDGDVDILDRSGGVDIFFNDANAGTFTAGVFDESASNGNKGGAAFCDFDDDGDFDLFWTDAGTNQIWEQTGVGSGSFTGLGVPAVAASGVDGVACGDVDNDGDLDLVLTGSGNDQLFRNDGGFVFTDITPASFGVDEGEATAFADYDRDGDVDLVINQDTANELWRNETNNNNYIVVRALHDLGGGIERDALGATIRLLDCSLSPVSGVREVNGGRGRGSQDPAYVHMGLPACGSGGPNARYTVEVRFLGGTVVQKAVWPSSIGGYQLVEIRDTDANDTSACTTAVALVSFGATGADRAVVLEWETGSEADNLGFQLYRAPSADGPFERITSRLIPGLGSTPEGARYHFVDTGLRNGATYFYRLEDVETTGRSTFHGPAVATPDETVPLASIIDDSEGASSAGLSFGKPRSGELSVHHGRPGSVVVELWTPGFHATPLEDGSVRVEIPGFEPSGGTAGLPVKRVTLDALATGDARIVSIESRDVVAFDGLRPAGIQESEVVMTASGTLRLQRAAGARRARREASTEARVIDVVTQGRRRKMLLELAPLRWNPETGSLELVRKLVVHIVASERSERSASRRVSRSSVVADLGVVAPGLYGVGFDEVFRRGRSLATSRLRLTHQGIPVPFHVEPDPDRFEPGSTLFFLSDGERENPYGPEAVYRLESGPGVTMPVRDVAASRVSAPVSFAWHRQDAESNRMYLATHPEAEDLWQWEALFAPTLRSYPFELGGVTPGDGPSRLSVWLLGGTDLPASPDHHVRLWINGVLVGEDRWNAKQPRAIELDLPGGALRDGTNQLEVENVGDTDAAYSLVFLDRFAVDYARTLKAVAGRFDGRFTQSGSASIEGLTPEAAWIDVSDAAAPVWLTGAGDSLRVEAGATYVAVDPQSMRRASIHRPVSRGLTRESNQADYILIGSEALLEAARPLIAHRREQGLVVAAVPLDAVYAEFGFGETTPDAIRSFLRHAYRRWSPPAPRYVLLLGDATYDFKDYLGLDSERNLHRLPPLLIKTPFMTTASDPTYAAVNGDDVVPDLAIGRLPAASVDELKGMVDKILRYETRGTGRSERVVVVADDPDLAGNFEADAQELVSTVLAGIDVERIYLRQLGASSARKKILTSFDEGASILTYLGHGGIDLWADEVLFRSSSIDSLASQADQPIVLTMNCLNGYFQFPFYDALAEALVAAEGRGAIATFSPSGFSLHKPAHRFQKAVLSELVSGGHERLGDAIFAAQVTFAESGGLPEMLSIYHLFGDPALVLPRHR